MSDSEQTQKAGMPYIVRRRKMRICEFALLIFPKLYVS